MHIQIINDEKIIINGVEYEYLKCKGRVLVNGIKNDDIINALKYLFFNVEQSKPMHIKPSFRDVRRDGRTLGVIYLNNAGLYVSITSRNNNGLIIEYFLYEKLAKYFILTKGSLPVINSNTMPHGLKKDIKKLTPGCFNMVYNINHKFAGFTFIHDVNQIEAFDIDFNRQTFNNYMEAERFIVK